MCSIANFLSWFSCFSEEPPSNNSDTPWLISFSGNFLKHENGWAAQDEAQKMFFLLMRYKWKQLFPPRTALHRSRIDEPPVCIPLKMELWFICTHLSVRLAEIHTGGRFEIEQHHRNPSQGHYVSPGGLEWKMMSDLLRWGESGDNLL